MCFFLMSQGSLNPKIRFLGQKMWSVAWLRTDRQTDTHESDYCGPHSGFKEFFFQSIIKDRPNKCKIKICCGMWPQKWIRVLL